MPMFRLPEKFKKKWIEKFKIDYPTIGHKNDLTYAFLRLTFSGVWEKLNDQNVSIFLLDSNEIVRDVAQLYMLGTVVAQEDRKNNIHSTIRVGESRAFLRKPPAIPHLPSNINFLSDLWIVQTNNQADLLSSSTFIKRLILECSIVLPPDIKIQRLCHYKKPGTDSLIIPETAQIETFEEYESR